MNILFTSGVQGYKKQAFMTFMTSGELKTLSLLTQTLNERRMENKLQHGGIAARSPVLTWTRALLCGVSYALHV